MFIDAKTDKMIDAEMERVVKGRVDDKSEYSLAEVIEELGLDFEEIMETANKLRDDEV